MVFMSKKCQTVYYPHTPVCSICLFLRFPDSCAVHDAGETDVGRLPFTEGSLVEGHMLRIHPPAEESFRLFKGPVFNTVVTIGTAIESQGAGVIGVIQIEVHKLFKMEIMVMANPR